MNKPVIAFFSDANSLSLYLVENLLSKNSEVVVFTMNKKDWTTRTTHIASGADLKILDEKSFVSASSISYAIFCFGFFDKTQAYQKFKSLYRSGVFENIKTVAIFPAEIFSRQENDSLYLNDNLAIIYVGDLFSPRPDFASSLRSSRLINEIVFSGSITSGIGEVYYPVFTPEAAKLISKWIFSFGPFGKETFVLGSEISPSSFWKEVAKLLPDTKFYSDSNTDFSPPPRSFAREVVATNLQFLLRETLTGAMRQAKQTTTLPKLRKRMPKTTKLTITSIVLILLFPILAIFIGFSVLFLSYKSYLAGRSDIGKYLLYVSKPFIVSARIESSVLGSIPLLGQPYRETGYILYLVDEVSDVGIDALPGLAASKELMTKIFGNEIYDAKTFSKEIALTSSEIYQISSSVQAETIVESRRGVLTARKVLNSIDFERIKNISLSTTKISDKLSELLGGKDKKTYLLLFQNNTELRPTGGFIGSFALVTFEGGRMIDFSVSDVYSADGQLRGHVEPPAPIKNYLGEANWFLRDSNWDPDFPTSAKRAEWFIDKEIDRRVDGVIGIDLNLIKDMLNYTGPIYLADYNMNITSANLYEKTQEEVQAGFFPGTHQKASFLTALSRNMVMLMGQLSGAQGLGVLRSVLTNLEERHLQAYFHDDAIQQLILNPGWSGEVKRKECGDNCYSDFLGLVEANVGVNKANYFVSREMNLNVNFVNGHVERTLKIDYKNSANPSLGAPAKYKSYVRLMVPADSQINGQFDITENRGLKEVGFLLEVLAGEEREVKISWSSNFTSANYGLFIRKQAGTQDSDKLYVAYDGSLKYNSSLTQDVWIPKP